MTIFALDTSSKAASCAILRDGVLTGESFVNAGLTHSQTIMPMVQALLRDTNVPPSEIDRFAVSVGPGSFTGLRIGISAVKGMAMGTGKPCAGVSTLEGLAWNLAGFGGVIAPVMDARCGQVYTALFRCEGGAVTRIRADEAVPLGELDRRLAALGEPVMLTGDGAELFFAAAAHASLRLCPQPLRHQRASSVALLAAKTDTEISPDALEPSYLRLPQAEREWLKKTKMQGGSGNDRIGK